MADLFSRKPGIQEESGPSRSSTDHTARNHHGPVTLRRRRAPAPHPAAGTGGHRPRRTAALERRQLPQAAEHLRRAHHAAPRGDRVRREHRRRAAHLRLPAQRQVRLLRVRRHCRRCGDGRVAAAGGGGRRHGHRADSRHAVSDAIDQAVVVASAALHRAYRIEPPRAAGGARPAPPPRGCRTRSRRCHRVRRCRRVLEYDRRSPSNWSGRAIR